MDLSNHEKPGPSIEVLPENVPVMMPELPPQLRIHTVEQFKALGDRTRERILAIIQHQPATAKQLAERLDVPPGTIGHHLQVLEKAGLAQIVARRLVRGTVAKYYTRTARTFEYEMVRAVTGGNAPNVALMTRARDELSEAQASIESDPLLIISVPRARLSSERARLYHERLRTLVEDFLHEVPDPHGDIYELAVAFFMGPAYLQDQAFTSQHEPSSDERSLP